MQLKMVLLNNPDLTSIQDMIINNLYDENGVRIIINVYSDNTTKEFGIYLKVKSDEVSIEFDTRVAMERHEKGHKHNEIHVQGDIKKSNLDFFKSGELHIFLNVVNQDQLLQACQGFSFTLLEILKIVEDKLIFEEDYLVNYFFQKIF